MEPGEIRFVPDEAPRFDQWGVVEVMGHKKFAGHITEQVIAGAALVRVDVPELTVENKRTLWDQNTESYIEQTVDTKHVGAFTKMIGVGSIYCITPTTEDVARRVAKEIARYNSDPLPVSLPAERQLAAVSGAGNDDDFEVDGDQEDDLP